MRNLFRFCFMFLITSSIIVSVSCEDDDKEDELTPVVEFKDPETLNLLWETTGLIAPESAVYDESNNQIFVSNQNQGDTIIGGFISKINADNGEVTDLQWVTGLSNSITGMGIYENTLYIAEQTDLTAINIETGEIIEKHAVEGAIFLNDVFVTSSNVVYISDTFGNAIYKLSNGNVELLVQDLSLESPNGLWVDENTLHIASFGVVIDFQTFEANPTYVYSVDLNSKSITKFSENMTEPIGNMDGIVAYGNGNYFISDWALGKIMYLKSSGETNTLLTLGQGAADICYIESKKLLLVPMAFNGKLSAYIVE